MIIKHLTGTIDSIYDKEKKEWIKKTSEPEKKEKPEKTEEKKSEKQEK